MAHLKRSRRLGWGWGIITVALWATHPLSAAAQSATYPTRVISLINPFSPGASTDIVARVIAQKLTEAWGQTAVVENRPGASGMIGLAAVARAPADGHMLGMMIVSHATTAALQGGGKLAVDLVRDFAPVTQVVSQPYLIVVNPSLPARSVKDLIALAKAQPGALTYGSSGIGSVLHLGGELLAVQTNVRMTHVPYKGAAPATVDLLAGQVNIAFSGIGTVIAQVRAGKLRGLATTGAKRIESMADLPLMGESGGPTMQIELWNGFLAPAGTPAAIVKQLSEAINRIAKSSDLPQVLATQGTSPTTNTPEEFARFIKAEQTKFARLVKESGIKLD